MRILVNSESIPHSSQYVLHQRQLVGVGSGVVDDLRDQPGFDFRFKYVGGTFNRFGELVSRQSRAEVLRVVECFGQSQKCRTLPQKIRTHCQHNKNRNRTVADGIQHEIHKRECFVRILLLKAKNFLELIDQHEQVCKLW